MHSAMNRTKAPAGDPRDWQRRLVREGAMIDQALTAAAGIRKASIHQVRDADAATRRGSPNPGGSCTARCWMTDLARTCLVGFHPRGRKHSSELSFGQWSTGRCPPLGQAQPASGNV